MSARLLIGICGGRGSIIATLWLGLAYGLEPAFANGGSRPLVTNVKSGPYELQVGIFPGSPKVGNLHLSIQLNDAGGGPPITDATITVTAKGPTGSTDVPPVRAINLPQSPQFYDADINLDTVGSWIMTVETDAGLGEAGLDVPFEVTKPDGVDIVFVLAGGIALLALGLWLLDRIGKQRTSRTSDS